MSEPKASPYTTLDMRSGTSRFFIKFHDRDPAKRRKDLAAARYLISQVTEALNIMEQNREDADGGQRTDAGPARDRRDQVAQLNRGEDSATGTAPEGTSPEWRPPTGDRGVESLEEGE